MLHKWGFSLQGESTCFEWLYSSPHIKVPVSFSLHEAFRFYGARKTQIERKRIIHKRTVITFRCYVVREKKRVKFDESVRGTQLQVASRLLLSIKDS